MVLGAVPWVGSLFEARCDATSPPPVAISGIASMTSAGLGGMRAGRLAVKELLSATTTCHESINPERDFAVITTRQSLVYAGIEPGSSCFCSPKSAPRVGDVVFVLKPNSLARLGLVKELRQQEGGAKWPMLQKWQDSDPKAGERKPYMPR